MICEFWVSGINKLPPDKYARLRAVLPELPEDPAQAQEYDHHYADLHDIKRAIGLNGVYLAGTSEQKGALPLYLVAEELRLLSKRISGLERPPENSDFNSRVNVHIPGIGLMVINRVVIEQDLCTEKLQEKLDDGWRIIAACPQPDQRRPDYVLGRTVTP